MPRISLDDEPLPRNKGARINRLKHLLKNTELKFQKLGDQTPYKPKSLCGSLIDIWNLK